MTTAAESMMDPVALSQKFISFASINPPGEEAAIIDFLKSMLEKAGMTVTAHEFAPNRPSLVATVPGSEDEPPLAFTGHIDVVPLGKTPWTHDPFAGVIKDGRLYGRGSSDMKAGVAAFIAATLAQLRDGGKLRRGLKLVITAGEETGCQGAYHLARIGALGDAALLIVAEPSSNQPILAHKGSVRMKVTTRGVAAHSSMPWEGVNAVDRAAAMICTLNGYDFNLEPHPLLGVTTGSVTTFSGGENINSVPDLAEFTIDFRTIPSHPHAALIADITALFGDTAEIEVVTNFVGMSTEPDEPAIRPLLDLLQQRNGKAPHIAGAPYFTDASALVAGFDGVPAVVIGPGELEQCHKTDEYCFVAAIVDAAEIYGDLINRMCR